MSLVNFLTNNYLTRGFWGDEAWTALISQFPLSEILRITAEDFHPPFYYFLVHGFIGIFGVSEWIRLISLFFYLLTPIPVYLMAKKMVGKGFGILVSTLVLLNPILFTYGFEARSYGLVAFICSFSTYVFWQALTSKKRKQVKWLVIYALTCMVGVYTHYYLWFIFAAHGLYWLVMNRKNAARILLTYFSVLLAQLPWLPSLFSQVKSVAGDYWIAPIDKRTHWEFFMRIVGGDWEAPQKNFVVYAMVALLIVSVVGAILRLKKKRQEYVYLWFWFLVPVIIPSLISLYRPVFFYRYLIFCAIPLLMIVMWGSKSIHKCLAWGVGGFIVAMYLSINVLSFARYPYSMRDEMKPEWAPLVTVLPSFAEVKYYAQNEKVYVLDEGLVQFSGKSLLDAFVRQGEVEILTKDETGKLGDYWLIEPGPKSTFYEN